MKVVTESRLEIELEELRGAFLDVIDNHPNNINPIKNGNCVYDDGEGNHCIVGQFIVDNNLGFDLSVNNSGAYKLFQGDNEYMDPKQVFVTKLQSLADNEVINVDEDIPEVSPVEWITLREFVEAYEFGGTR